MKSLRTWELIFLGVVNTAIAAKRAVRQHDPMAWLTFATILLAEFVIVVASVRLQNGFSELSEVDVKTSRRLRMSALSLALMANVGILSALYFVH